MAKVAGDHEEETEGEQALEHLNTEVETGHDLDMVVLMFEAEAAKEGPIHI